ncbi:hypothetical protein AKJ16_DCAP24806 [Drosera capensis]
MTRVAEVVIGGGGENGFLHLGQVHFLELLIAQIRKSIKPDSVIGSRIPLGVLLDHIFEVPLEVLPPLGGLLGMPVYFPVLLGPLLEELGDSFVGG